VSDPEKKPQKTRFRWAGLGALTAVALGITAAVLVSNGGGVKASSCAAQPEAAAAIDAAAQGELAALVPTAEGRGFADLGFEGEDGSPMTLGDLSGKSLLVNFWATWCVPCRKEMPALDALSSAYGGDDFEVVTINLDTGSDALDKARSFLEDEGLTHLPLYADSSFAAFNRLKSEGVAIGLPASLLLDEKGCEIAILQGPAEWDSEDGRNVVEALIGL
jgi:thiol-disulfide isomerase/thioredoxin